MMIDLTWDNYLELNNELINNSYENVYYTPVQLVQWLCYDIKLKYHKIDNCILFYMKEKNSQWKSFNPFYEKNFNKDDAIKNIKSDLILLNGECSNIEMLSVCEKTMNDWQFNIKNKIKTSFISNYIYELDQLKTFSGNKMQKKRNHLNSFIKEKYDVSIKNIREVKNEDLISFAKKMIEKYNGETRDNEINSYIMTLNEINKDDKYSGIVIYIDNNIVAFTLGYWNNDTYEIIIEKAERDIKGLFQYLIKTNLEFNNIESKFIDRLDDLGLETLKKSKMSYRPIIVVERYNIIF